MELQCEFMSCKNFESKGKRYFMATFSNSKTGPFDSFVSEDLYFKLAPLTYLQSCICVFELTCRDMRLGVTLKDIII
nr:unnamed protein product [uncultured bacterium]